jgi:hypothetical protein
MFLMWIHGEDGHPLPASNEAELRKQLDENGISGGLMDAVFAQLVVGDVATVDVPPMSQFSSGKAG